MKVYALLLVALATGRGFYVPTSRITGSQSAMCMDIRYTGSDQRRIRRLMRRGAKLAGKKRGEDLLAEAADISQKDLRPLEERQEMLLEQAAQLRKSKELNERLQATVTRLKRRLATMEDRNTADQERIGLLTVEMKKLEEAGAALEEMRRQAAAAASQRMQELETAMHAQSVKMLDGVKRMLKLEQDADELRGELKRSEAELASRAEEIAELTAQLESTFSRRVVRQVSAVASSVGTAVTGGASSASVLLSATAVFYERMAHKLAFRLFVLTAQAKRLLKSVALDVASLLQGGWARMCQGLQGASRSSTSSSDGPPFGSQFEPTRVVKVPTVRTSAASLVKQEDAVMV